MNYFTYFTLKLINFFNAKAEADFEFPGKCALGLQLFALGFIPEPEIKFESDCARMLEVNSEWLDFKKVPQEKLAIW